MKPATQARIDSLMEVYRETRGSSMIVPSRERMRQAIRSALLEQDRDARHACAEAVSAVYTGERVMTKAEIIHAAHQACMRAISV